MLIAKKRATQRCLADRQSVKRVVAVQRQHALSLAGRKVKMISVMLIFFMVAVALVAHFTYLVDLNHRIGRSSEELRALQDDGKHLKLEIASLRSPQRIEKWALEMGLQYPGQEQLVILTAVAAGN